MDHDGQPEHPEQPGGPRRRPQPHAGDAIIEPHDDGRMPRRGRTLTRTLGWGATFLAFPIAGLAAMWTVGAIDDPVSATIGGATAGAVIGAAQALGSRVLDPRRALDARSWIAATSLGMGLGLLAASAAVGYGTGLAQLALMGAITGVPLGLTQAAVLPRSLAPRRAARLAWAVATPMVLALGWTVTTLIGVDVAQQFAVFGASGALVATALTGGLLAVLAARSRAGTTVARPATATPPAGGAA